MVQFPPDIDFLPEELRLPAPDLFKLLRRQLHWVTQEGEQLRVQADALERQRKEEWEAKELLVENYMEAQVATEQRRRADAGLPEDFEGFGFVQSDMDPARALKVSAKDGKVPWWREDGYPQSTGAVKDEVQASKPLPLDARMDQHPSAREASLTAEH